MTIGERIKARRKELDISVDELAEKLGKNRATIYRYESDEIENMPTAVLEPLAKALQTTPAYLMGWSEKYQEEFQLSKSEQNHLHKYRSIDGKGKHTVDTVLEMEYNRCNKPHLVVNAAHAIEGATEEEIQHDDDIMDDENF
jgi:transcriptional regulator with XRE-family HTH domain